MPSKAKLVCVPPGSVEDVWRYAGHFISSAVQRTGLADEEIIRRGLFEGRSLLWVAVLDGIFVAAASTEVVVVNGAKTCELTACGGDGREHWIELLEGIESYAKAEGCASMRIFGRKGWQRVLPAYQVKHIVLERRL